MKPPPGPPVFLATAVSVERPPVIEETGAATVRLSDLVEELGFSFNSAFEDAIIGGKSLSDILSSLEDDILRVGLRTLVTEPLFAGIKAGLKGETTEEGGIAGTVSGGISIGVGAFKDIFGIGEEGEVLGELKTSVEAATTTMGGLAAPVEAAAEAIGGTLVGGAAEAAVETATLGATEAAASAAMGEAAVETATLGATQSATSIAQMAA